MNSVKAGKCSVCTRKLTSNELSDNIYAGLKENQYICYTCQTVDDDEDDDDDMYDENEY